MKPAKFNNRLKVLGCFVGLALTAFLIADTLKTPDSVAEIEVNTAKIKALAEKSDRIGK